MRRIVIAIGSTLTGLVLLFSWPTSLNRSVALAETSTTEGSSSTTAASTDTSTDGSATDESTSDETTSDAGATEGSTDSSTTTEATPSTTSTDGTYTGDSISTEFGPVQVQITVTDGVVTSAEAIAYPNTNSKDQRINSYAIPTLNAEVVEAQSASIQMVSGATYTSNGYIASLQSALDQAGL